MSHKTDQILKFSLKLKKFGWNHVAWVRFSAYNQLREVLSSEQPLCSHNVP
jgi:hypothetical protein